MLVVIAGAFAVAQLRDAETQIELSEVHLVKPLGYVLLSPLSEVLDAVTLLSARQHVAVLLGLLGIWVLWQFAWPWRKRRERAPIASFAASLACIAVAYVAAALLPRPMSYLAPVDPDTLRIDFHSHTNSSRDARQSFSVDDNRAWHRAGGYDVAYVTDHKALAEVQRGQAMPPGARRDVILLQGIEADWKGEHVGLIGPEQTLRDLMSANLRDLHARRFTACSHRNAPEPILIWNHPRASDLEKLPFASCGTTFGLSAIEISNGALHGMDLVRRKRQQIVELARKHNLALVSGTDNHGWGYVTPNWTLVRVRNWRELRDDEIAIRIEDAIRENGYTGTRVIERATVDPGTSAAALALTVLVVPWRVLTTLSVEERLIWMGWIWVIAGIKTLWRRRHD